jgi:hypothetical protein
MHPKEIVMSRALPLLLVLPFTTACAPLGGAMYAAVRAGHASDRGVE